MSEIAHLRVRQIRTTRLQPGGLLSTNLEKYQIHKSCISKALWEGREWCNVFNDQFQMKRADNFLKLRALGCLQTLQPL